MRYICRYKWCRCINRTCACMPLVCMYMGGCMLQSVTQQTKRTLFSLHVCIRVCLPRTLFFKKCPISKTLQDTFPGHFLRPAVSILFLLRKVFINVLSKKCLIPYCAVLFFILINLCNKKVSSPILCRFIVYTFQSVQ